MSRSARMVGVQKWVRRRLRQQFVDARLRSNLAWRVVWIAMGTVGSLLDCVVNPQPTAPLEEEMYGCSPLAAPKEGPPLVRRPRLKFHPIAEKAGRGSKPFRPSQGRR